MEITVFELKILRYIDSKLSSKHSPGYVTNADIFKKFGEYSRSSLNNLYSSDMIACPMETSNVPGVFIVSNMFDNWNITSKGKCYLANHRLVSCLTFREKALCSIGGFVLGILTAFATNAVNYIWNIIIK